MLKTVVDANAHLGTAQLQSVELFKRQAADDLGAFMGAVASAVASSATLQNQIEMSRMQSEELAKRQEALEEGMERLIQVTSYAISRQDQQTQQVSLANNVTSDLLDTLEAVSASAVTVNKLLMSQPTSKWWPFIVCPAASLLVGSYGLPPSVMRNMFLVAFGEVVGYFVAVYPGIVSHFYPAFHCSFKPPAQFFKFADQAESFNETEVQF